MSESSAPIPTPHHFAPDTGRKVVQLDGAKLTRERKRTKRLMESLPRGVTIGERRDGRPKPYFVRYGTPRKVESFATEEDRNDHASKLGDKSVAHGSTVLDFDPAEWAEFKAWKAGRVPVMLTKDAVEKYLALRLAEDVVKDSDTHSHLKKHLVARFVGQFGEMRLDHITPDLIRDFLAGMTNPKTGEPMSKVTVKNHRKDVNTFFKRAVAEEWCRKNPCAVVKPPKIDDEAKVPLKPREIFDLLKFNRDEPVVGRIALELFGGLRASSAERLTKDHLKFASKGIAMPGQKHKSGKWKYRQGHPDVLWEWLNHAPASCWTNISPKNYGYLKSMAFVRARVTNPGNVLRDSFASYMLALTKNMGLVGYLMQHTRASTTEGYEGAAEETDAKLVMAMTPAAVQKDWDDFRANHEPARP